MASWILNMSKTRNLKVGHKRIRKRLQKKREIGIFED